MRVQKGINDKELFTMGRLQYYDKSRKQFDMTESKTAEYLSDASGLRRGKWEKESYIWSVQQESAEICW